MSRKHIYEIPYGSIRVLTAETEAVREATERILRGTGWSYKVTEETFPEPDFESSKRTAVEGELVSSVLVHENRNVDVCQHRRNVVFDHLRNELVAVAGFLSTSHPDRGLLQDESILFQKAMGIMFSNPAKAIDLLIRVFLRKTSIDIYRLPEQTRFAQESVDLLFFDTDILIGVVLNGKRYSVDEAMLMAVGLEAAQRVDVLVYYLAASSDENNPRNAYPVLIFENEMWGIVEAYFRAMQDKTTCRESYESEPKGSGPVMFAKWLLERTGDPLIALAGMAEYVGFDMEDLARYGWGMMELGDMRSHRGLMKFLSMMDFVRDGGFIDVMEHQEKIGKYSKDGKTTTR